MCTAITLTYPGGSVIGRTMDFEAPVRFNAVYVPKDYPLMEDAFKRPVRTQYSLTGVVFEGENAIKDGVNSCGLAGITNMFTGFGLYAETPEEGKRSLSSLDFFGYVLGNFASVEEIRKHVDNFQLVTENVDGEKIFAPDFHYMFTDPTGDCIVLEPKKGRVLLYENALFVMTNSPGFSSMKKKAEKFFGDMTLENFLGARSLPGGFDPVSRFIKAYDFVKMRPQRDSAEEAVADAFSILDACSMPKGFVPNRNYNYYTFTRYICVYDTENRMLYLKNYRNPAVYALSFSDVRAEGEREEFFMDFSLQTEKFGRKS